MTARPSPGDLLVIDGRASVQFAGDRALTFRVVSVCDRPTYEGWIWLTGYVSTAEATRPPSARSTSNSPASRPVPYPPHQFRA